MELVRLACDGCGADIELPGDARFVTCRYCDARLEVRRTEGAAFTRVRARVEKVERRTDALEKEVHRLEKERSLEREIDALEREWAERRERLMNRGKDGSLTVPTRGSAVAIAVSAGLAGLLFGATAPGGFGLPLGLAFCVLGGVFALTQDQKAVRYEQAQSEYLDRRDDLAQRLKKLRGRKKRRRER